MKKTYWKDFWEEQTTGLHRSQEEAFLKTESKEKLFHLGSGEKLLDFGCGSADLFVYYTSAYHFCVGIDRSKLLLEKAAERIKSFQNQDNTFLINSDHAQMWHDIEQQFGQDFKFDCITTGQVIQYLEKKQIDDFIRHATAHLTDTGKICLFDIVDSRTHELWKAGLYRQNSLNMSVMMKLLYGRLKGIFNKLRGKPSYELGYAYPPAFFADLAKKYNLQVSCANSMYYEYRYHIFFEKLKTV